MDPSCRREMLSFLDRDSLMHWCHRWLWRTSGVVGHWVAFFLVSVASTRLPRHHELLPSLLQLHLVPPRVVALFVAALRKWLRVWAQMATGLVEIWMSDATSMVVEIWRESVTDIVPSAYVRPPSRFLQHLQCENYLGLKKNLLQHPMRKLSGISFCFLNLQTVPNENDCWSK